MSALNGGLRTADLARAGERAITTEEMGGKVVEWVERNAMSGATAPRR